MIKESHYKAIFEKVAECQAANRPCVLICDETHFESLNGEIESSKLTMFGATNSVWEARGILQQANADFTTIQSVWICGQNKEEE